MNFLHRYQTTFLFVLVVLVLYGGYQFFFAPPSEDAITAIGAEGAPGPDQELIALLLQLKNIHLDDALFNDPLFKSLEDFGKELVPEAVGRVNPFAPFGGFIPVPLSR